MARERHRRLVEGTLAFLLLSVLAAYSIFSIDLTGFTKGISQTTGRAGVYSVSLNATTLPLVNKSVVAGGSNEKPIKYAYAFLMAGCDPVKPSYLGYVYNILVATRVLREAGSEADVVVLVRMAASAKEARLPQDVHLVLEKAGVVIKYIPGVSMTRDNFASAMMDKFRVLELIEYRRVLFLDSDVMPLCNLDYMFKLAEGSNPVLRPNVILAYNLEPAQGGFFMLSPMEGDYAAIQDIRMKYQPRQRGYKDFDIVKGWGHVIEPPDFWESSKGRKGTNWTFHGAGADQGLLYHWAKYVKKDLSIINNNEVQTWGMGKNESNVQLIKTARNVFNEHACSSTGIPRLKWSSPPYNQFIHFVGRGKPWLAKDAPQDVENMTVARDPLTAWYHVLRKVNKQFFNMSLDVGNLKSVGGPILGFTGR